MAADQNYKMSPLPKSTLSPEPRDHMPPQQQKVFHPQQEQGPRADEVVLDPLGDFGDDFNILEFTEGVDNNVNILDNLETNAMNILDSLQAEVGDKSQHTDNTSGLGESGEAEAQVEVDYPATQDTEGISLNIVWCASLVLMMTMIRQGMTTNCHYRPSFVPLLQFHQFLMVVILVKISLVRLGLWIWPWPPRGMTEIPPDDRVYRHKRKRGRPRRNRHTCGTCGKQFLSRSKCIRHEKGHNKEDKADLWYVCPHKDCGFTRKKKVNLVPLILYPKLLLCISSMMLRDMLKRVRTDFKS